MTEEHTASQQAVELLERHTSELRHADSRFYEERISHLQDTIASNDRRYTEVNIEREKALSIEKNSTAEALRLAREAQNVKDKQTEQLRDETLGKSGIYATNDGVNKMFKDFEKTITDELTKINNFISGQRGATGARGKMTATTIAAFTAAATLFGGVITALIMRAFGL